VRRERLGVESGKQFSILNEFTLDDCEIENSMEIQNWTLKIDLHNPTDLMNSTNHPVEGAIPLMAGQAVTPSN